MSVLMRLERIFCNDDDSRTGMEWNEMVVQMGKNDEG